MSKIKTVKQQKARTDRVVRVKRTVQQLAITALVSVYPTLITATDWNALQALLPTLGFIALGGIVTDLYNRVRPA